MKRDNGTRGVGGLISTVAVLWLNAGCAPAEVRSAEDESGSQRGGPDLHSRQAGPFAKHAVVGASWQGFIDSREEPKLASEEGYVVVRVKLDGDTTVECAVFEDSASTGSLLRGVLARVAQQAKLSQIRVNDVQHVRLDPVIDIRAMAQKKVGEQIAVGYVKLVLVPRIASPLLCLHGEPGFAESFFRVAHRFADSIDSSSSRPKPVRGEFFRLTLNGRPIGFERRVSYDLTGGRTLTETSMAQLLPAGPGELFLIDEQTSIIADDTGHITLAWYALWDDGEPNYDISLERSGKTYNYAGTIEDKEIEGSFITTKPLRDERGLRLRARSLYDNPQEKKFTRWEYRPSVDPERAIEVSYELEPGGEPVELSASPDSGFTPGRPIKRELIADEGEW